MSARKRAPAKPTPKIAADVTATSRDRSDAVDELAPSTTKAKHIAPKRESFEVAVGPAADVLEKQVVAHHHKPAAEES